MPCGHSGGGVPVRILVEEVTNLENSKGFYYSYYYYSLIASTNLQHVPTSTLVAIELNYPKFACMNV